MLQVTDAREATKHMEVQLTKAHQKNEELSAEAQQLGENWRLKPSSTKEPR